jgi:hypothetical protein
VGGLLTLSGHQSRYAMALPRREKAPNTGVGLPEFMCWLNYICVRGREPQKNSFARINANTADVLEGIEIDRAYSEGV